MSKITQWNRASGFEETRLFIVPDRGIAIMRGFPDFVTARQYLSQHYRVVHAATASDVIGRDVIADITYEKGL